MVALDIGRNWKDHRWTLATSDRACRLLKAITALRFGRGKLRAGTLMLGGQASKYLSDCLAEDMTNAFLSSRLCFSDLGSHMCSWNMLAEVNSPK